MERNLTLNPSFQHTVKLTDFLAELGAEHEAEVAVACQDEGDDGDEPKQEADEEKVKEGHLEKKLSIDRLTPKKHLFTANERFALCGC